MRGWDNNGVMLDGDIAFLSAGATVKFVGTQAVSGIGPSNQATQPETGAVEKDAKHATGVIKPRQWGGEKGVTYALWGGDNRLPDRLFAEANLSGILRAGLTTRRDAHYGSGPMYYRLQVVGNREVVVPLPWSTVPAAMRAYHQRVQMERALKERIKEWEWWGQCVVEHVLSRDQNTIVSTKPLRMGWTRWSLMDSETGRIQYALYNGNFGLGYALDATEVLPVADPWWTPQEVKAWARANGYWKFVRCIGMPDPMEGYYPQKDWHTLYNNSWLQQTNSIALNRRNFATNAMSVKYHIEVPDTYLPRKFVQNWDDWTDAERESKRRDFLSTMNKWLAGEKNAGKAMVTEYQVDEVTGKGMDGWKITPLADKYADNVMSAIADSEKGNSEILATLRVDPTLLGQGAPGGKLGAGSGSDKQEAIRIMHALMLGDRESTTDDWYFVRDYNGWDSEIYMGYRPMELKAMDATEAELPPSNAS